MILREVMLEHAAERGIRLTDAGIRLEPRYRNGSGLGRR
jgi:hypothetical protein